MTTITLLGVASMLFVATFTFRAYRGGSDPRAAIVEAWINLVIGFSINFVANLVILPMALGVSVPASANWWMGWAYTSISILRQYAIRRWFQGRIHRAAQRLALVTSKEPS